MENVNLRSRRVSNDMINVRAALVELQKELQKIYAGRTPALLVYGSYARGEASADSDVDVLLLYPQNVQPGREIYRLREILSVLNLRYQTLISILPADEHQYQNSQATFWKNIRKETVGIERI